MRHELGWEAWEAYTNKVLGLSATVASGSQDHDPGDGVDRRHHSETDYALMASKNMRFVCADCGCDRFQFQPDEKESSD